MPSASPSASMVSMIMRAPVCSPDAMLSSIACMIEGTPAMTKTFLTTKPGAAEPQTVGDHRPTPA